MNSKSNLFVSIAVCAVLAACKSTPSQPARAAAPAPAPVSAAPSASAPKAVAAGTATASAAPAGAPAAVIDTTPIPPRAAQQYAQALQMMKAGRSTDAELEFKQLIVAYPQYAGPQLNLGLMYLQASKFKEAEVAFKAAQKAAPANPVAGDELGIVERKLGKFSDAEAAYLGAISAEPNYAQAHLNLGVLYDLYLGEPQKALEQFERYLEIAGENKQVAGWVIELRKRVGAPAPAAKKEQPA